MNASNVVAEAIERNSTQKDPVGLPSQPRKDSTTKIVPPTSYSIPAEPLHQPAKATAAPRLDSPLRTTGKRITTDPEKRNGSVLLVGELQTTVPTMLDLAANLEQMSADGLTTRQKMLENELKRVREALDNRRKREEKKKNLSMVHTSTTNVERSLQYNNTDNATNGLVHTPRGTRGGGGRGETTNNDDNNKSSASMVAINAASSNNTAADMRRMAQSLLQHNTSQLQRTSESMQDDNGTMVPLLMNNDEPAGGPTSHTQTAAALHPSRNSATPSLHHHVVDLNHHARGGGLPSESPIPFAPADASGTSGLDMSHHHQHQVSSSSGGLWGNPLHRAPPPNILAHRGHPPQATAAALAVTPVAYVSMPTPMAAASSSGLQNTMSAGSSASPFLSSQALQQQQRGRGVGESPPQQKAAAAGGGKDFMYSQGHSAVMDELYALRRRREQ